jgi:Tfp pilus assembly protein PilN
VGLALRASVGCRTTLNLCPQSVRLRRGIERRRSHLVAAVICVIIGLLGMGLQNIAAARVLNHNSRTMEQQIVRFQSVEQELNQVQTRRASLDRVATPLLAAISDRSFWTRVLEELNARLPEEKIWITDLVGAADAEADGLLIHGLYLFNPKQQEVVVDYFRNLSGSTLFAIDLRNQGKSIKPSTPNETEWAYPYELRVDLRKQLK